MLSAKSWVYLFSDCLIKTQVGMTHQTYKSVPPEKEVTLPVPYSKRVSVQDQYKCNSSSLLNHKLIHVNFVTRQTCVLSDFTMARLGPGVRINFHTGIEPTISRYLEICPPFWATLTVKMFSFAPLIDAWRKRISSEKASKIYYMIDLHL